MRGKILILVLALLLCFAACAEETVVPFGEPFSFETQITSEGKARLKADDAPFETLNFTLEIKDHRGPMHFKKFYGEDYALKGSEAVVEIRLTLNGYEGDAPINPNRIILLTLQAENGETAGGYSLMNWEMAGSGDIPMASDLPIAVFKRYDFDEDAPFNMRYLAVHTFNDGEEEVYLMDMIDPDGKNTFTIVYDELKRKSRGKAVKELQTKLSELGLLQGSVDGVFGPKTAESVKAAQALLGFEETGIATHEFQKALFKYVPEPEPTAGPTPEPTPEPTVEPTAEPTPEPTAEPTAEPTSEPTAEPTPEPTAEPAAEPSAAPETVPAGE